jgi:hypothetical protein
VITVRYIRRLRLDARRAIESNSPVALRVLERVKADPPAAFTTLDPTTGVQVPVSKRDWFVLELMRELSTINPDVLWLTTPDDDDGVKFHPGMPGY